MRTRLLLTAIPGLVIVLHLAPPLLSCRFGPTAEAVLLRACDPDPAAAKKRACAGYGERCRKNLLSFCQWYKNERLTNECLNKVPSECAPATCEAKVTLRTCPAGKSCAADGWCR